MSFFNRLFARATLLLTLASCAVACGVSGPNGEALPSSAEGAISGGELDTADSNVFLLVSRRSGDEVALCSASLIAPNLLLTARHCVASTTSDQVTCGVTEAGTAYPANTFFATNAPSLDQADSAFGVSAITVPTEGSDICGFDLALVTLKSVVPATVATPLVPRIDVPVARNEAYSAVGYGQDSAGDAGVAGVRRGRSGLRVNCAPEVCTGAVAADEFIGETGICSGDSGGPALDKDGKVVGVVSRSAADCNHPVYGSVAAWRDFIVGASKQAAAVGNYEPASWVTAAPVSTPAVGGSPGAGGAGEPGGASAGSNAVEPGAQGEACSARADCQAGFGCYSASGSASARDGYCAEFCSPETQCPKSSRCNLEVGKAAGLSEGVCVDPLGSASAGSSCALTTAGRPSGSTGWLATACLALTVAARKRRRTQAKR